MEIQTAVINKIPVNVVEENYTLKRCIDVIKTHRKNMLEEKLYDEQVNANAWTKDRKAFYDRIIKEIEQLDEKKKSNKNKKNNMLGEFGNILANSRTRLDGNGGEVNES